MSAQVLFSHKPNCRKYCQQLASVVVDFDHINLGGMHLYNLTLQPPTAATQAIVGNFSGARTQEIIISRGTRLELLRPDVQTGKLSTVIASDVFGSIRSLAAFRLTGSTKGEPLVRIIFLFPSYSYSILRLRNRRLRFWPHHHSRL